MRQRENISLLLSIISHRVAAASALSFIVFHASVAAAQSLSPVAIVDEAAMHLKGKVVPLRHVLSQSTVKYDRTGKLLGNAKPGDWTLHSQLQVVGMRFKDQTLYIKGDRVALSFENESDSPEYLRTLEHLEIQIEAQIPFQLEGELRKAFLTASEKVPENLPTHWTRFLHCPSLPANESCPNMQAPTGFAVGGNVHEPRLKSSREPIYTTEARALRLEGQVQLRVLVDETGKVSYVEITQPLGLGLDERSVAAVKAWNFGAGTRDGRPVPVYVQIYLNFSLK